MHVKDKMRKPKALTKYQPCHNSLLQLPRLELVLFHRVLSTKGYQQKTGGKRKKIHTVGGSTIEIIHASTTKEPMEAEATYKEMHIDPTNKLVH